MSVVAATCYTEINAAVAICHALEDVAIAVSVVTNASENAPPCWSDIEFEIDDATVFEIEVKVA